MEEIIDEINRLNSPVGKDAEHFIVGRRFNFVKRYLKNVNTILDVGCGCGYSTKLFHDAGYKVKGFDFNKKAIEYGRKKYSVDLEWADAGVFNKGKYDAIISFASIEHIQKWEQAILNWKSMLNENGVIIIMTDNGKYGKYEWDYKRFTVKELKTLFPGCKIIGTGFHFIFTKPLTVLFGGNFSVRFRIFFDFIFKYFPEYCNDLYVVWKS